MLDSPSQRPTLVPLFQHPLGERRKRGGLPVSPCLPLQSVVKHVHLPYASSSLLASPLYSKRCPTSLRATSPSHSKPVARDVIRRRRSETSLTPPPWFFVLLPCLFLYGILEMSICLVVDISIIPLANVSSGLRTNRQCDYKGVPALPRWMQDRRISHCLTPQPISTHVRDANQYLQ
jgi:hypothetical protein